MASPKTHPVTLAGGIIGRAVKLTEKNISTVSDWINKEYQLHSWDPNGAKADELRLFKNGGRQILVARVGDLVVKVKGVGFHVIKASKK